MNRSKGFIVLNREILDWEWYGDLKTKVLFLHLLLTANHKEQKWQGKVINKGELITSIAHLSAETGLSQREVRTALNHLKSTGEVTVTTTNRFTLIFVVNWGKYQDFDSDSDKQNDKQTDNQATSQRQANDKPATTNNKGTKEQRNNIEIEDKPKRFIPPTLEEVKAYCSCNGYNVDCERFVAFYESNGWKVGKNKMKDWKASVRGWHSRNKADGRYTTESEPKEDLLSNSKYEVPVFMDRVELARRKPPVIED